MAKETEMIQILKDVRKFFTDNPDWWPTNDLGVMTANILDVEAKIRNGIKQPSALDLIAAEREKQISKGYTVEHDAAYVQRTKITFDMIAINLVNRYQCPPEWDQAYWDGLCNLTRPDRLRIAATWMARELERIIHLENKES